MSDISTFESFRAPRGHEPFPVPWSSVRERFESVATAVPDNIAVVCRGSSLSYRELHSLADAHARALVGHLGSDRRPVALDTTCSLDCVVALVSVLLSGHPLVLLDSQLPEDRRHHILTRSGAARISPAELAALPRHPEQPLPAVSESDCAVLLFTSGSTGTPKAVRQGHRLWLNQAADFHATLGIGSGDRLGMALPISFGGGLDVVFSALLNGGELHFLDPREVGIEEVPQWISSHMLTTLHATPSLLRAVMKVCAGTATLTGLRLVTTCGEAVHGDDVARLRTLLSPTASYCNLSGSSETGNLAFNEFPAGRDVPDRVLPVGVVAANKVVRLLGPDGADVAPGEVGEIVVESPYLSEGYFVERDGTATAEITKFGRAADGTRSFRMGDLGRFDQHGLLHLVGRSDDAVKVRGYLVEPSEVESALRRLPAVEDAIVLARQTDSGAVLVGYVAVDPATRAPSAADLRRDLRKTLPDWMIPANLMLLPALPRNERGKVDRGALPAPSPRPAVIPPPWVSSPNWQHCGPRSSGSSRSAVTTTSSLSGAIPCRLSRCSPVPARSSAPNCRRQRWPTSRPCTSFPHISSRPLQVRRCAPVCWCRCRPAAPGTRYSPLPEQVPPRWRCCRWRGNSDLNGRCTVSRPTDSKAADSPIGRCAQQRSATCARSARYNRTARTPLSVTHSVV